MSNCAGQNCLRSRIGTAFSKPVYLLPCTTHVSSRGSHSSCQRLYTSTVLSDGCATCRSAQRPITSASRSSSDTEKRQVIKVLALTAGTSKTLPSSLLNGLSSAALSFDLNWNNLYQFSIFLTMYLWNSGYGMFCSRRGPLDYYTKMPNRLPNFSPNPA
jgi:hypothetical protein